MARHIRLAGRALPPTLVILIASALSTCTTVPVPTEQGSARFLKLAFATQPANATAGAAISPAVIATVQDSSGNTDTAASNGITIALGTNPSNGTLSGTTTVTAVNGMATFPTLSIGMTGSGYTLVASATGLTGATSAAFSVAAGSAAKLGFVVQPSAASAGQVLSPAVQVEIQDAEGNAITTATNSITLAIGTNPGNGTLSGTTTVTAVNGVATFSTLSLSKGGVAYTLNAYATGLRGATSAAFSVAAGSAAQLGFVLQPSVAGGGRVVSPSVQVAVQDAQGSIVTTATNSVTLAIGTNVAGATLSGTTTVAAVNGVATFSTLRIDKPGSGYTLVASTGGLTGATSDVFAIVPSTFQSISWGGSHSCALVTIGAAYCWGLNDNGELGNGSTSGPGQCAEAGAVIPLYCSSVPIPVSGGLTFAAVSAGLEEHTCGITTGGAAFCWGYNAYGQLGNGTTTNSATPVPVSGGLAFAAVSAGYSYTCGIATTGAAYCWGTDDGTGALGNGTTTGSPTPAAVSGGLTFVSVSAGATHTCGVTRNGTVYCWGDNGDGQLGNGTTTSSSTPVAVSGGLTLTAVIVGVRYSCGLTPDGFIYCWGDNTYGQLGNGTTTATTSPVAVSGSLTFSTVSTAGASTCGVALTGAAYCWGRNLSGELGNGTSTNMPNTTPVAVSGGLTFAAVGGTCGLTLSGAGYCWGDNLEGGLGNGTTTSSTIPVPIM
jgi:alpha-tubulin suppressor-like RCC1 family protein